MSEETTVFKGSPSLVTRFGALFLGFLVFAACVVGAILLKDQNAAYRWVLGAIAALALLYLLVVVLLVKATQYEVTTERIRIRKGLLNKRTDELELYRANDTSLIEPFALRVFGLGTIEVRTADSSTPVVFIEAIHDARGVREQLRKCIEECRERKRVRVTEFENPPPGNAA